MSKRILILAANPKDTTSIRLTEEVREIEEALKRSENRSQFTLQIRWAVRSRDLLRAMTEFQPNIVHFCGHGELEGIALEDNYGNSEIIPTNGLASLFKAKAFTNKVECVLLNACYSIFQVEAIGQYIDYVVGMEQEITDKDAIDFAVSFYDALGSGESYESAYELGCIAMQLAGAPENLLPLLHEKSKSSLSSQSQTIVFDPDKEPTSQKISFQSLRNALETHEAFAERFVETIDFTNFSEASVSNATRYILNADKVCVYNYEQDRITYESNSEKSCNVNVNAKQLASFLKQNYFKAFTSDRSHKVRLEKGLITSGESYVTIIPQTKTRSIVLVVGSSDQVKELEDITALMLGCLYELNEDFGSLGTKEDIQNRMYDSIKVQYNYVSDKTYEYRFAAFQKSLKNLQVFFEPILFFDKQFEHFEIAGWEALARDSKTLSTPKHIFKTAEMWGIRFQTELDLYILETALKTYKNASEKANLHRYSDHKMLSINVYPSSILRTAYEKKLEHLLVDQKLISGNKLILEVSEKTLIPSIIEDEERGLESFRGITRKYRKKYGIKFAVDDFGVGHAAISRLEEVNPTYVKIDREVLHFDKKLRESIINYLVGLKLDFNYHAIIEGLDEDSPFLLRELVVDFGVEYIQGHILGLASSEITERLEKEKYQEILKRLGWGKS